jgi:hypothetical protein
LTVANQSAAKVFETDKLLGRADEVIARISAE